MLPILWDMCKITAKNAGILTWVAIAAVVIIVPIGVYLTIHLLADLKDYH